MVQYAKNDYKSYAQEKKVLEHLQANNYTKGTMLNLVIIKGFP